jgi:hypothetical protein
MSARGRPAVPRCILLPGQNGSHFRCKNPELLRVRSGSFSTDSSGLFGWLKSASTPCAPNRGRARSIAFGQTPVIQTPKPELESCATNATTGLPPTTLPSFNSRQSGYGCALMSPRPSRVFTVSPINRFSGYDGRTHRTGIRLQADISFRFMLFRPNKKLPILFERGVAYNFMMTQVIKCSTFRNGSSKAR